MNYGRFFRQASLTGMIAGMFLCSGLSLATEKDILLPSDSIKGKSGKATDEAYVLKPGDRIKITIYPEDEFIKGGEMQISSEGNITLPLVGKVEVGQQLIRDAEAAIRKLIDADYLVNPEVVIEVVKQSEQSKIQIVLLGAVRKPGSYEFPAGETKVTLLKLMSDAGGFSEVANVKKIKIVREVDGKKNVIRANAEAIMSGDSPDVELQSGDIVHVSESMF
jgi:polysaccharide export outer membrane protein